MRPQPPMLLEAVLDEAGIVCSRWANLTKAKQLSFDDGNANLMHFNTFTFILRPGQLTKTKPRVVRS